MKVKVLQPFFYGGRFKAGEIVDIPKDLVKALGPRFVEPLEVKQDVANVERTEELPKNNRSGRRPKAGTNKKRSRK